MTQKKEKRAIIKKLLQKITGAKQTDEQQQRSGEEEPAYTLSQQMQNELRCLADEIKVSVDRKERTHLVLEESVRQLTPNVPDFTQNFPYGDFEAYREPYWAGQLMPFSGEGDFFIVGYAPCIPTLLSDNARRIRTVHWSLSEAVCTGTIKEFVDDFYDEYGIVIHLQTLAPMESLRKAYPVSDHSVTVLDFSKEEYLSAMGVSTGSIWLDMDADEKKERRITAGNTGITYVSLKTIWRKFQRFS